MYEQPRTDGRVPSLRAALGVAAPRRGSFFAATTRAHLRAWYSRDPRTAGLAVALADTRALEPARALLLAPSDLADLARARAPADMCGVADDAAAALRRVRIALSGFMIKVFQN